MLGQQFQEQGLAQGRLFDPVKKPHDWRGNARGQGISPDDVVLGREMSRQTPVVRFDSSNLNSIAAEGIHNQHRTKTSNGMFDPDFRAQAEEQMFGTDRYHGESEAPIYGYLDDRAGKGVGDNSANQYGNVRAVIHPERAAQSTMTIGDSLSIHSQASHAGGFGASGGYYDDYHEDDDYDEDADPYEGTSSALPFAYQGALPHVRDNYRYNEVQFHGGTIEPEHIDHFDVDAPNNHATISKSWGDDEVPARQSMIDDLTQAHNDSGIPWRMQEKRTATQMPLASQLGQKDVSGRQASLEDPDEAWHRWDKSEAQKKTLRTGQLDDRARTWASGKSGEPFRKVSTYHETVASSPQFQSVYDGAPPGERVEAMMDHFVNPTPASTEAVAHDQRRRNARGTR